MYQRIGPFHISVDRLSSAGGFGLGWTLGGLWITFAVWNVEIWKDRHDWRCA